MPVQEGVTIAAVVEGQRESATLELERFAQHIKSAYNVTPLKFHSEEFSDNRVKLVASYNAVDEIAKTVNAILSIAEKSGIRREVLLSKTKRRRIVRQRDILCFILRHRLRLSHPVIAKIINAKSHASSILACRKFDAAGLHNQYRRWSLHHVYNDACKRHNRVDGRQR